MTRQRLAATAAAIALATMVAGCSTSLGEFFTSPPSGTDQQLAIPAAMKVAQRGCVRLADALKPGEVEDLATSLEYVSDLLSRNPDITPEQLAEDLVGVSEDAAVFAPEILGVAALAAAKIPEDARAATFYLVLQGVVSQCRKALAGSGTAMLSPPGGSGARALAAAGGVAVLDRLPHPEQLARDRRVRASRALRADGPGAPPTGAAIATQARPRARSGLLSHGAGLDRSERGEG